MAWPKGKPRGPASGVGRPAGSRNKCSAGIEAFALSLVEDSTYRANLQKRMQQGTLGPGLEAMFFAYAYGKPREQQPDDQAFIEDLLVVVLKHAGTPEARQEIRDVIETHAGGTRLRVVA